MLNKFNSALNHEKKHYFSHEQNLIGRQDENNDFKRITKAKF